MRSKTVNCCVQQKTQETLPKIVFQSVFSLFNFFSSVHRVIQFPYQGGVCSVLQTTLGPWRKVITELTFCNITNCNQFLQLLFPEGGGPGGEREEGVGREEGGRERK